MKERHGRPSKPPVKIGTAEDEAEVTVWKAILDGEGIPCLVKDRNPLAHYWLGAKPFARYYFDVFVPMSAAKRARALLAPSLRARRSRPFTSPVRALSAAATILFFSGLLAALILAIAAAVR